MAKAAGALIRLLGKKVVFNGKFGYSLPHLKALAEAQQGVIDEDLSTSTDYLVLADASAGKTIQKKVTALNAKGASIQVMDSADFEKMVQPTEDEVLALIRNGAPSAELFNKINCSNPYTYRVQDVAARTIAGEKFDGLDLSQFNFHNTAFDECSFVGTKLGISIFAAKKCDFSQASSKGTEFGDATGSLFKQAQFAHPNFGGAIDDADFTGAKLSRGYFSTHIWQKPKQAVMAGVGFKQADLKKSQLFGIRLKDANFESADCTGVNFSDAVLAGANFKNAILRSAVMLGGNLAGADFSGADLRGATLAEGDLTGAKFDRADLTGCNLRNTTLKNTDLSKAKGYDANAQSGTVGPALTALDALAKQAKRIQITFLVKRYDDEKGIEIGIDTVGLQYGWATRLPPDLARGHAAKQKAHTFSDAMLTLANVAGHLPVQYETVDIQSTKSPTAGKELRELVLNGICEAFAQPIPDADILATATKAHREVVREQGAADRERREQARKEAEAAKAKEAKQAEKKIAKAVGKVTDIATFLKALELRADKQKIDKATKMLKASGFQLYNDIADGYMSGVVKSQTDPDLVYACRIEADGKYACCTQNLNICGGLRGSICKHLLVLIIGLVKAGELDPSTIDGWVAKSSKTKAELDKEVMGEIFIRYKGAEAGEVDWRPTETLPEDYYAL